MPEKQDRGNNDSPPHRKAANGLDNDSLYIKCGKSVHSDGMQYERCSNWEHRDCTDLFKGLYKALSGFPVFLLFELKVKLAVKFSMKLKKNTSLLRAN